MSGLSIDFPPELIDQIADAVVQRLADQPTTAVLPTEPAKLAVSIAEAADLLGMSADHFRRHVLPDLRIVRSGRLKLVPIAELRTWLDSSAARVLAGARLAHGSESPHDKRGCGDAQGSGPGALESEAA